MNLECSCCYNGSQVPQVYAAPAKSDDRSAAPIRRLSDFVANDTAHRCAADGRCGTAAAQRASRHTPDRCTADGAERFVGRAASCHRGERERKSNNIASHRDLR